MVLEADRRPAGHLFEVTIRPDDIDHMNHVNNAVYLRWVQDAVVDYWVATAPPEAVAKHLWVALRHCIDYRRPAFLGDRIFAEVVTDRVAGPRAFFRTCFRREHLVLAEVQSIWCCLDASSGRPSRLAAEVAGRFLGQSAQAVRPECSASQPLDIAPADAHPHTVRTA